MLRHLVILAGLACALPRAALALEASEIFKLAEPSVVVVLASNAKGDRNVQTSGVLIAALDVLTSCKGVADSADIVVTQGGALRPAALRHADLGRDLCQLRLREPLPAARIAQSDTSIPLPRIGDDVYLVSAPYGLDRTFSRVMLSGLREVPGSSARLL
jgi:S1-C subfamily serine protease